MGAAHSKQFFFKHKRKETNLTQRKENPKKIKPLNVLSVIYKQNKKLFMCISV